jgi:hypothetical protein
LSSLHNYHAAYAATVASGFQWTIRSDQPFCSLYFPVLLWQNASTHLSAGVTMTKAPAVFVSPTFYDLKQIRADLRDFITTLGLIPVISEYGSFPIDPTIPTVENCLKVVDENADIFVLMIGARYGTIKDQGKSVTNMEYLKAGAKGIPIYVFIEKSILNILPLWSAERIRSNYSEGNRYDAGYDCEE